MLSFRLTTLKYGHDVWMIQLGDDAAFSAETANNLLLREMTIPQ
jgi:hypothetical protein